MQICRDAQALDRLVQGWKAQGQRVGFVPTMGALHEGHLSLVRLAVEHSDRVVVSIYVNPTQFAPGEDFAAYPRPVENDLALLGGQPVDAVFLPQDQDIYPNGPAQQAHSSDFEAAKGLESDFRPHFFGGVATVVGRFFEVAKPDMAVFGEKDYQQLQVIRELVARQGLGIEIVGAPIARDAHGLALSSRNIYLSREELEIARMMNQILYHAAEKIASLRATRSNPQASRQNGLLRPSQDVLAMTDEAKDMLLTAGFDRVDYVTFKPEWGRVLVAAWLGKTRLIDNCRVQKSSDFCGFSNINPLNSV